MVGGHEETDGGIRRMDFQAVCKALSYYVDYITFLHRNLLLFDRLSVLFPDFANKVEVRCQETCTDEFLQASVLFQNEYDSILNYLHSSRFRAYASVGKQKTDRFFEEAREVIEKCEEMSAELGELLSAENRPETARSLLERFHIACIEAKIILSSGVFGFEGCNIVEDLIAIAEYYGYLVRIAKLQHALSTYKKALAQ